MVQGYYGLEEAAEILGLSPERLSQMAQRRGIRACADRGTWRFRTQDVEEVARRFGRGSSPELQLGEAPQPAKKAPAASPPAGVVPASDPGMDTEQVDIGQELFNPPAGGSK